MIRLLSNNAISFARKSNFDWKKALADYCGYCGLEFRDDKQKQVDHLIPVSEFINFERTKESPKPKKKGFSLADTDENTWVLCASCNDIKRDDPMPVFHEKYQHSLYKAYSPNVVPIEEVLAKYEEVIATIGQTANKNPQPEQMKLFVAA